jgi:hypothetical protein
VRWSSSDDDRRPSIGGEIRIHQLRRMKSGCAFTQTKTPPAPLVISPKAFACVPSSPRALALALPSPIAVMLALEIKGDRQGSPLRFSPPDFDETQATCTAFRHVVISGGAWSIPAKRSCRSRAIMRHACPRHRAGELAEQQRRPSRATHHEKGEGDLPRSDVGPCDAVHATSIGG